MKKYVLAMIDIWKNMVIGRSRKNLIALACLAIVALFLIIYVAVQVKEIAGNSVAVACATIAVFAWFFFFPAAVYLIDKSSDRKHSGS